jgi:hypothetical protein
VLVQLAIIAAFAIAGGATVRGERHPLSGNLQPLTSIARSPGRQAPTSQDEPAAEAPSEPPRPSLAPSPILPEGHPAEAEEHELAPAAEAPVSQPHSARVGSLIVEANPPGTVVVDERERGKTPLTLHLPTGTHAVVVHGPQGAVKQFRVEIPVGKQVRRVVTFPFIPPQPGSSHWP